LEDFYEKNEPGSFTPRQSNCKKNAGIFLLEGIGQTLSQHPFAEPFTMTQKFLSHFSPLRFCFLHRVTCFGHFLKMAPMVSKDSPHRHEMGLRWEFV